MLSGSELRVTLLRCSKSRTGAYGHAAKHHRETTVAFVLVSRSISRFASVPLASHRPLRGDSYHTPAWSVVPFQIAQGRPGRRFKYRIVRSTQKNKVQLSRCSRRGFPLCQFTQDPEAEITGDEF